MNKIVKITEKMFRLECEDGSRHVITRGPSHDKRDDSYWLYLPENSSNRGSVRIDDLMNGKKEYIEFPTVAKKEKRILGSNNWKSFLNSEESEEYEKLSKRIEELEKIGRERAEKAKNDPVEKLKAEIAKKIASMKELGLTEDQIRDLIG